MSSYNEAALDAHEAAEDAAADHEARLEAAEGDAVHWMAKDFMQALLHPDQTPKVQCTQEMEKCGIPRRVLSQREVRGAFHSLLVPENTDTDTDTDVEDALFEVFQHSKCRHVLALIAIVSTKWAEREAPGMAEYETTKHNYIRWY